MYWRKYERTEKEQRRKAEKEAVEQRKIDDEMREVSPRLLSLHFMCKLCTEWVRVCVYRHNNWTCFNLHMNNNPYCVRLL